MDFEPNWSVVVSAGVAVRVQAPNWLVALGRALDQEQIALDRSASEKLPNGTIIVRDLDAGRYFTVRQLLEHPDYEISIHDFETAEEPRS